jgi:hypothetical protein
MPSIMTFIESAGGLIGELRQRVDSLESRPSGALESGHANLVPRLTFEPPAPRVGVQELDSSELESQIRDLTVRVEDLTRHVQILETKPIAPNFPAKIDVPAPIVQIDEHMLSDIRIRLERDMGASADGLASVRDLTKRVAVLKHEFRQNFKEVGVDYGYFQPILSFEEVRYPRMLIPPPNNSDWSTFSDVFLANLENQSIEERIVIQLPREGFQLIDTRTNEPTGKFIQPQPWLRPLDNLGLCEILMSWALRGIMWKRVLEETTVEPGEHAFVCFGSDHCMAMINAMAKTLARYPDPGDEASSHWREFVLANSQSDHNAGERQTLADLFNDL